MAGDLPIEERLLVLSPEAAAAAVAAGAPRRAGTPAAGRSERALHIYGDRVRVLSGPPEGAAGPAAPQTMPDGLSEVEALGFAAARLRLDPAYAEAKRARPRDGETWDFEGSCVRVPPRPERTAAPAVQPGTPTSAYLEGSVAVGLIIVEGLQDDLRFDGSERVKTVAEVQNGLTYYASTQPSAGLSFTYDIRVVQVDVPPNPDVDQEALWREPAMRQLGYDGSWSSVGTYIEDLRQKFGTRWAYCAFITKYPLGWFAYAYVGGPYLVMNYYNDGWGVENIDRVYAHETGHIFTAPDEYAGSGCSCGGSYGARWGKPNDNCENCAQYGVPCLMKANDFSMCVYTPGHLGWMPARMIAKHTGKAADIGGSQQAHGAHLIQSTFSGGVTQWFRPDPIGDGYVRLVAFDSSQVLDVAEGRTDNGAPLILWDWHGGDNQLFKLEPLGDGYVRIVPKNAQDKVLGVAGTSNGDAVVLGDWHGGDSQHWLLTAPLVVEHSAKVMAVAGASTAEGAAIVQWDPVGHAEQIFRPEPIDAEHVRLVCHHSGKVVTVRNASRQPGAPAVQATWTGADNQRFKLVILDGTYRIIAKHSGMVLTVAGASTADGAIVVQQPWTGGDEQRWLVPYVETATPPAGAATAEPVSAGLA
ncbi:MAG TPA: RICIN domain-containing protein [Streptosporangiaceae bacterium]